MSDFEELEKKTRKAYGAAKHAGVGIEIAATLALGVLGGHYLDEHFQTSPFCMLGGTLLGFAGMVRVLLRVLRSARDENQRP
ncbi:MAG: AtpZ/AtpI family protein [Myxococcales bacterium]|nr:AtpZ/AtpI family protein [Myxococcales bacterium]